eukprot:gene35156-45517_t
MNFSSSLSSSSDIHIELLFVSNISQELFGSLCWSMYVAHYATTNGDTWASELGVLSQSKPRLVTSLFFVARMEGCRSWFPMFIAGFFNGSLIDSILGASIQASYYNIEKKYITKSTYRASAGFLGPRLLIGQSSNMSAI